jgi:hypothetical protein
MCAPNSYCALFFGIFIWHLHCKITDAGSGSNDTCEYIPRRTFQSASLLHTSECKSGHWPITKSCYVANSHLTFDISSGVFSTSSMTIPDDVLKTWNISAAVMTPLTCSFHIENALFLPLPFDKETYQSDGSNYYVIHVDTVLPLWNYFRTLNPVSASEYPVIIAYSFNIRGEINLTSEAFNDPNKYWIRSVQLQFDHHVLVPGTLDGLRQFASRLAQSHANPLMPPSPETGTICFGNVQLGLALFDTPSRVSVARFAADYRQVPTRSLDITYCLNTVSVSVCNHSNI